MTQFRISGLIVLLASVVAFPCPGRAAAPPPVVPVVANAAVAEVEWQKLETKPVPFRDPRHILSAGLYDRELQHTITFPNPNPGVPVDLELPHFGKDKNGKDYPPLMAHLAQGAVWIDLNGDGKVSADETRRFTPDGFTDPFTAELHYEDGTSGPYTFCLKTLLENEKYSLQRAGAREVTFQNTKLLLLDEDGNGKYSDEHDAIVVGDAPPCLIGKYIAIGDKYYEIVVHAAGSIEIRPAPKMDTGTVDMFLAYKPSQKAESLTIHSVVISGPTGSYAFDEKHRTLKVPVGAYDMVFGLFERSKEWAYMKKGERTTFTVAPNKVSAPPWGGTVTAKFDIQSDGTQITVDKPVFIGDASEHYVIENYRQVAVIANLVAVFTDTTKLEHRTPVGSQKFKATPEGDLSPLIFKAAHTNSDYEVSVDLTSGILGSVLSRQKFHFVYKKKEKK